MKEKTEQEIKDWEELLKDLDAGMTIRALGRKYDIPNSTLTYKLAQIGKAKDSRFVGEVKPVAEAPDGYFVKGTSSLLDAEGNVKLQWLKTERDKDDGYKAFKEALDTFLTDPRVKATTKIKSPTKVDSDTLSLYALGDAHIGAYATKDETGALCNVKKTTADILTAMDLLVEQAHPSKEAFVYDTGDFFTMNNASNTTTKGTPVDVGGRFTEVIQAGLDIAVALVEKALTKHKVVHWRSAIGNHDTHTSLYVSSFIKAWFREDKRVIVHDTANRFFYHKFGKNLFMMTHGDTVKPDKLGQIMSIDCKDIWSKVDHRYALLGHVHHGSQIQKEYTNVLVETFNSLAGKDAWHTESGYRSVQSMKAITYNKLYGEVSRNTVHQSMIRASQNGK